MNIDSIVIEYEYVKILLWVKKIKNIVINYEYVNILLWKLIVL